MRPPAWALITSAAGIVALVGGWLVAAAVQPPGYDPVRQTISALARQGLDHREIMTAGLAGLGIAYVATAIGLRCLRGWSRGVLALGGVATLLVAGFAQPRHGSSAVHIACATVGFIVLAVWPATTMTRSAEAPTVIRPAAAGAATAASFALLGWVAATQSGGPLGLSERLLTFEQALWPFVVVVALRRRGTGRLAT